MPSRTAIRSLAGTVALLALAAGWGGCVPYPVGTTAQPAPEGRWTTSSSAYAIPNGLNPDTRFEGEEGERRDTGASFVGVDAEARIGLDGASDLGIRAPGGAGLVVNYKRRVAGDRRGPALAVMGGGGFLNAANNAHLEFTLIASGRDRALVTPYGGLRAMQAFPLSDVAEKDSPTLGGFGGVRIGEAETGVSLEVGVFYDPSALDLRESDWIIVPSITVSGALRQFFPF